MAGQQYSRAQMEAMARQAGFPSYDAWLAWNRQRSQSLRGPQNYSTGKPQRNFLETLMQDVPLYPATMFRYISDKFSKATGGR